MILHWTELTKNQFDDLRESAVVAANFSSTEQHSNHLPVGTDGYIGEEVLTEAARRAKHTVVLMPPVRYGYSPHHKFAPGYVTLRQRVLTDLCKDLCGCAAANGFRKMAVMNSHGGNTAALHSAVNEVGEEYEGKLDLALFTYWDLIGDALARVRESPIGGTSHGGEFETSLMMHLRPDLVVPSLIEECDPAPSDPYNEIDLAGKKKYISFYTFNRFNASGHVGQPHLATPEKGKIFFEEAAQAAAEFLDFLGGK
ncbi:creatininase family protein [Aminivibrio sp.]